MTAHEPAKGSGRRGRLVRSLMIGAISAITVAWIFHFPYNEETLYRIVSPDAKWVSEHDRLSERWNGMAHNPMLLGVLSGMDISPEQAEDFMIHGPWGRIIRLMTGRRAVVEYEDSMGKGGKPGWAFASWVGGPIQLVRWNILPRFIPGMKLVDLGLEGKTWMVSLDSNKARVRRKLVITTRDGLLLGVISENPMMIRRVLGRMNAGQKKPGQGWHPGQAFESQAYSDRAWMMDVRVPGLGRLPEMTLGCSADNDNGVSGEIRIPSIHVMGSDVIDPDASRGLQRLLVTTKPDTFFCGSDALLQELGVTAATSEKWSAIKAAVQDVAPKATAMCAALLSDEFSGRIHGVKIRSMVAGFPVGGAVTLDGVLAPIVDYVNTNYPWDVITRSNERSGVSVRMLDCGRQPLVAGLEEADKPACAIVDGWFFMFSNLFALDAFLRAPRPQEDSVLSARLSTSFYARSDIETTHGAIRNLLSVYLLSQLFDESSKTKDDQIRGTYAAMNQWASLSSILKDVEMWVEVPEAGGSLKLAITVGSRNEPEKPSGPAGQKGLN